MAFVWARALLVAMGSWAGQSGARVLWGRYTYGLPEMILCDYQFSPVSEPRLQHTQKAPGSGERGAGRAGARPLCGVNCSNHKEASSIPFWAWIPEGSHRSREEEKGVCVAWEGESRGH